MSSLLAPAIRKTAARSPAMIHRAMFIINSFIEDYLCTPQDKTAAPAVTPPSTPARARGRGGVAMLGTGWQRLHDERRPQRIVKIARDRHRARRQAGRRPGAARPHSIGPEHAVRGAVVKNRLGDL